LGLRIVTSAPVDIRQTFELFRFYRPEIGLEPMLQDAGIGHLLPRQIYHAVHNRAPDDLKAALPNQRNSAIDIFISSLSSEEFQANLAPRLLHAFPEKRRLFFVHIPKTGGVDLATHLISRFPSINTKLHDPGWTGSPEAVFLAVKHIVLEMSHSDTIFISGHTPLGEYQGWNGNGIRYQDHVFTVVREPLHQIISQINYVLTRIFAEEDPIAPDTTGWRSEFAVHDLGMRDSAAETRQLAQRILRHTGVVVPNIIASYLGGGRYEDAVAQTVAHDLEVVELKHLDTWCEERWGITQRTRRNASAEFISLSDFSYDDLEYARGIVQQDQRYYADVTAALERYGTTSIKGAEIISQSLEPR
jgi:hypothetical protein